MSECVYGHNPPADHNPDCERCGLVVKVANTEAKLETMRILWDTACDSVDRLEAENAELRAKVEAGKKSRERTEKWAQEKTDKLVVENRELMIENAELRAKVAAVEAIIP
jgi:regulator of replication initiation timing